eukprot:CAMPEP_0117428862 /NCGR_PEP_ID=MMETSP0758-20121206/8471_1 /TAXON_ID=63605 /ORGANISM="Percolomonas cosmopolitus, Strain AE-1 (ATCC 50343)" /LENGTH=352 /DNA_ID=CAMNT_0005215445 /DNA_START=30 /DNA_END=1085 /DNA_ORIENTATION=-
MPFMPSGKVKDGYIGLPPNKERDQQNSLAKQNLKSSTKVKNNTKVLSQHKRYIRDLQRQKQMEKLEYTVRQAKLNEEKAKFQEQQAKLRQILKDTTEYSDNEVTKLMDTTKPKTQNRAINKAHKHVKPKKTEIPAWARPQAEINEEGEEVEDLLSFAETLDFDKYIDDYEVREALAVIHSRVNELNDEEHSIAKDIAEDIRQENRAAIAKEREEVAPLLEKELAAKLQASVPVQHEKEWNASTRIDDDTYSNLGSLADSDVISHTSESINQIHSKRSTAQIAKKVSETPPTVKSPPSTISVEEKSKLVDTLISDIHKERAKKQATVVVTHSANHHHKPEVEQSNSRILLKLK